VVDAPGWLAYANHDHLFVKSFKVTPGVPYPDRVCAAEVFTNRDILELESLSGLWTLAPGEQAEHVEHWSLFENVPTPRDEPDVVQSIAPFIDPMRRQ
jgi:hypothetical protein